jgi:hypothetical protein
MQRWLEGKQGATERDKIVSGFQTRIWQAAKGSEEEYKKLGVALSLIWRDFIAEAGSLQDYAAADRDTQKKLLVELIDYELSCREEGNQAESVGAELLSYLIAMVAAHDKDGEEMMAGPIEELARIGDPGIVISRTAAG